MILMRNLNLNELIKDLDFKCLTNQEIDSINVEGAYVSDLLSDVMGKAKADSLWITSQTHKNIIAVASLKDLSAIVVVNERKVADEVIEHANKEGVVILESGLPMYETVGKLFVKINA